MSLYCGLWLSRFVLSYLFLLPVVSRVVSFTHWASTQSCEWNTLEYDVKPQSNKQTNQSFSVSLYCGLWLSRFVLSDLFLLPVVSGVVSFTHWASTQSCEWNNLKYGVKPQSNKKLFQSYIILDVVRSEDAWGHGLVVSECAFRAYLMYRSRIESACRPSGIWVSHKMWLRRSQGWFLRGFSSRFSTIIRQEAVWSGQSVVIVKYPWVRRYTIIITVLNHPSYYIKTFLPGSDWSISLHWYNSTNERLQLTQTVVL